MTNAGSTPNPIPTTAPGDTPLPAVAIDLHVSILVGSVNDLINAINQLIALLLNMQQQNSLLTTQNVDLQNKLAEEEIDDADLEDRLAAANAQIASLQASGAVDVANVQSSVDTSVNRLKDALSQIQSQLPATNIPPVTAIVNPPAPEVPPAGTTTIITP